MENEKRSISDHTYREKFEDAKSTYLKNKKTIYEQYKLDFKNANSKQVRYVAKKTYKRKN